LLRLYKTFLFQSWLRPTSARRLHVLRHGPSDRLQGVANVARRRGLDCWVGGGTGTNFVAAGVLESNTRIDIFCCQSDLFFFISLMLRSLSCSSSFKRVTFRRSISSSCCFICNCHSSSCCFCCSSQTSGSRSSVCFSTNSVCLFRVSEVTCTSLRSFVFESSKKRKVLSLKKLSFPQRLHNRSLISGSVCVCLSRNHNWLLSLPRSANTWKCRGY
jgi:hypothetical protein